MIIFLQSFGEHIFLVLSAALLVLAVKVTPAPALVPNGLTPTVLCSPVMAVLTEYHTDFRGQRISSSFLGHILLRVVNGHNLSRALGIFRFLLLTKVFTVFILKQY